MGPLPQMMSCSVPSQGEDAPPTDDVVHAIQLHRFPSPPDKPRFIGIPLHGRRVRGFVFVFNPCNRLIRVNPLIGVNLRFRQSSSVIQPTFTWRPSGAWRGGVPHFYKHAAPPGLRDLIVFAVSKARCQFSPTPLTRGEAKGPLVFLPFAGGFRGARGVRVFDFAFRSNGAACL